jgi:hypothetical protein
MAEIGCKNKNQKTGYNLSAKYSRKLAKDIAALKAVSQNLMHSNLSITDGVYGILSDNDIQKQIAELGNADVKGEKKEELVILIR